MSCIIQGGFARAEVAGIAPFRAGGFEAGRNRHSPGNLYNPGAFHNIRLMKLTPNQGTPGARIDDIDLSQPISEAQFATILAALGRYGVLCFPKQALDARALKAFSERFGSLQGSPTGTYCEPGVPEVMLLSNILEDGKPIGLADAGQDWHTDMSYNPVVGFTNVLYAVKVPRRDGLPLGNTVFADMHAAYDDLSPALKTKLANATATHDFNKFWEEMRAPSRLAAPGADARSSAPRARPRCIRCSSPIRSPGVRCSTPIPVTPCASTNSTRRKATPCSTNSSAISCSRNISTPTVGPKATC